MVVEVDSPTAGSVRLLASPIRFSRSPAIVSAQPTLGQHHEEIFSEILGMDHEQIESLRSAGVI